MKQMKSTSRATRSVLPAISNREKMPSKRPIRRMTGTTDKPTGNTLANKPTMVTENALVIVETKKRKHPVDWSDNATVTLLNLINEFKVHNNGSLNLSNSQWREVMKKLQPNVPGLEELRQLKNKWDKIQTKFRDEKESCEKTGAEPSNWPFYARMEELKHGCTRDHHDIPGAGDDGNFGDETFQAAEMQCNMSETFMTHTCYEPFGSNASFQDAFKDTPSTPNITTSEPPKTVPHETIDTSPRSEACKQPGVCGKPTSKKRSRRCIDQEIANGISRMAAAFGDIESKKLDFMKEESCKKMQLIKELELMRSANSLKIVESMAIMTKSICQMTKETLLEIAKLAAVQNKH